MNTFTKITKLGHLTFSVSETGNVVITDENRKEGFVIAGGHFCVEMQAVMDNVNVRRSDD